MPIRAVKAMTLNAGMSFCGQRLDIFVASEAGVSRSQAQELIADGAVTVDGKKASKSYKIAGGEIVEVVLPEPKKLDNMPQELPVKIIYEDEYMLVVDKPRGMVVHPAAGNPDGTLVNALLYHCAGRLSSINGVERPGIVHRIDKMTSGLLMVAKTDEAHNGLAAQIASHSFDRKYEAVVIGNLKEDEGRIDRPIARHKVDRKKMCVDSTGREATTLWRVLDRFDGYTHVECTLLTGRTHQIRVHMQSIGHPLLGDIIYGDKTDRFHLDGQCLWAKYIAFTHPITGERMQFTADMPEYFSKILAKLDKIR